ncbi:MAG: TIGR03790 family protein [Gammaproteobacteria bacterium]|nr:TIGR03790 family protein [Gammaproteobacteria bacterium]
MHELFKLLRVIGLLSMTAYAGQACALNASQLAVIVNVADPVSVQTGAYYRLRRGIPDANVIEVRLPHDRSALSRQEFESLYAEVSARLPGHIRALALAWTKPWRAGCMGITSAFAFGYDESFCSASCGPTRASAYFNGGVGVADDALPALPAMMLAGESFDEVRALIERGISADFSYPKGTAYLVRTGDYARNVRARNYEHTLSLLKGLKLETPEGADALNRHDVIGYFTGAAFVPQLASLTFLPGAPADHLTSFGGQLLDSSQMSILAWLSAGATASYGTVVEPCNHLGKFSFPGVLLGHYADGDTLIEAYWKSVAWPGEGVFVGEPLARPFGTRIVRETDGLWLEAHAATGRRVVVEAAPSIVGPYRPARVLNLPPGYTRIALPGINAPVVRVR